MRMRWCEAVKLDTRALAQSRCNESDAATLKMRGSARVQHLYHSIGPNNSVLYFVPLLIFCSQTYKAPFVTVSYFREGACPISYGEFAPSLIHGIL